METFILDYDYQELPTPPFSNDEKQAAAKLAYDHVWQQCAAAYNAPVVH